MILMNLPWLNTIQPSVVSFLIPEADVRVVIIDHDRFFIDGLRHVLNSHFSQGMHVVEEGEQYVLRADIVIRGQVVGEHWGGHVSHLAGSVGRTAAWLDLREGGGRPDSVWRGGRCYAGTLYRTERVAALVEKLKLALSVRETLARTEGRCRQCEERHLTERERCVMRLMGYGLSQGQISHTLGIHPKTVSAHKCSGMRKLGLRRTVDLFLWLRQSCLSQCD